MYAGKSGKTGGGQSLEGYPGMVGSGRANSFAGSPIGYPMAMEVAQRPREADGVRNVLIVVNEAVQGAGLEAALVDHLAGQQIRVLLVAPALVASPLDHEMGQIDAAIEPARERLERSLSELRKAGIEAIGEVGDSDPILAISDELQKFPADEIILVTHREEDQAYAEQGLLERAHHDFPVPITELTVTRPPDVPEAPEGEREPPAEAPHLVGIRHEPAEAGRDSADMEISPNFPPLRARDTFAMIYGLVGSILLVIIAADSALSDAGSGIEGTSAARMLIAIGALLINGGHSVALIFFQSVRYEGVFERFASGFTIVVTTIALIVSLMI